MFDTQIHKTTIYLKRKKVKAIPFNKSINFLLTKWGLHLVTSSHSDWRAGWRCGDHTVHKCVETKIPHISFQEIWSLHTCTHANIWAQICTHSHPHAPAVSKQSVTGWRALEYRVPATCCALQFQNKTSVGKRTEGIFPHLCTLCIPNKDKFKSYFLKLRKSSFPQVLDQAWSVQPGRTQELAASWNGLCIKRVMESVYWFGKSLACRDDKIFVLLLEYVSPYCLEWLNLHFTAKSAKFYTFSHVFSCFHMEVVA